MNGKNQHENFLRSFSIFVLTIQTGYFRAFSIPLEILLFSRKAIEKILTNSPFRGFPTTMPPSRGLHHAAGFAGGALIHPYGVVMLFELLYNGQPDSSKVTLLSSKMSHAWSPIRVCPIPQFTGPIRIPAYCEQVQRRLSHQTF